MTDKFYKLIIAYNQQYPNKEVTMWLLYSYGTEEAIKIIQNRASEIMEQATLPYLDLDVPLKVEGGHAINWYLAH